MDQCRNRCWPFHRIREPGKEWNLCRFASCAEEETEGNNGNQQPARFKQMATLSNFYKVEGPDPFFCQCPKEGQQTTEKTKITNPVDDKSFICSGTGTFLFVVIADQQIGTETNTFPTDKHNQRIATQNQHQHSKGKQVHIAEETVVSRLTMHIAN